jgi:mono/diheme cytochrome c family protein
MRSSVSIATLLALAAAPSYGIAQEAAERPGLVAEYRSLVDPKAKVSRVDAKPAFTLGDSSPHPRLPPGPFSVRWTGSVHIKEPGLIQFEAFVGGKLRLAIDGEVVLEGRGRTQSSLVVGKTALERKLGWHDLQIEYESLADVPARLQLWWQGPTFSREPIPAWRFQCAKVLANSTDEESAAAGRRLARELGCARCHRDAFPGITDPPPGPSLHDVRGRINHDWLVRWLEDPVKVHADARMPRLFAENRSGYVERWIVAKHLVGDAKPPPPSEAANHRMGRQLFLSVGCLACHFIPDEPRAQQPDLDRSPLRGLGDRLTHEELTKFLTNPHGRYPDGRMPRLPLTQEQAADIAAYLLLWSPRSEIGSGSPPTAAEVDAVVKRLKTRNVAAAASALLVEKRCLQCHPGLGPTQAANIPIKIQKLGGCLGGDTLPQFGRELERRLTVWHYWQQAQQGSKETHWSPFHERQRQLERAGCIRCHPRDQDRPSPLEVASSSVGGAYLQYVPFQRTPRLTNPLQQFTAAHVRGAIREGVSGLRVDRFTFRMPAFGAQADTLAQALAEADGELVRDNEPPAAPPADPTAASLLGPQLVGFQGYACVSCHLWNGQKYGDPDPGAVATDLLRVPRRIRREWFDRFLEDPLRVHPGTPMPGVFPKGKPALLTSVLDGDAARQKDTLWHYFALGPQAPSPKPPPPLAVAVPEEGPLVAQIPVHLPDLSLVEGLAMLDRDGNLVVYDLGSGKIRNVFVGGQLLRTLQSRLRTFVASGTEVTIANTDGPPIQFIGGPAPETPTAREFHDYARLADGVRLRWRMTLSSGPIDVTEVVRVEAKGKRRLVHEIAVNRLPDDRSLVFRSLGQMAKGARSATVSLALPDAKSNPVAEAKYLVDSGIAEGSLERPGYQAVAYPRPKNARGEDAIMPVAVAVHPIDGRVFVASMKMGEIFVVREPRSAAARFEDYGGGAFQEAYSMLAEKDSLYVLHRRNLSKLVDKDGVVTRVERVTGLPHGIGDTYDYGYGLAKDKSGAFVYSFAPHANRDVPGSGGALRLVPGKKPQEVAFGFRNPIGWCAGSDREIFATDNQGEWVATNKLVHIAPGRFYGYPNRDQPQHTKKPFGKTAVWVPYGWARSINGMAYDNTHGKFGPFAGQIFLAELMYGGGIVRASLEKVNGEYQGACFPFWGKGLLGPVSLAFDPSGGSLYVGSITEPGWMAQPDRGALYRIDFTGDTPFEMQSIHVRPRGFRIVFTKPVDGESARKVASYQLEHYRYEYTGAYGSPELDRTPVKIERIDVATDGKSVELTTAPLVRDRVYLFHVPGLRSREGTPLVNAIAAYTLNEIPSK